MLLALFTRGRHVTIHGHRLHHGLTGLAFIAFGFLLCLDDAHDRRVWVSDFRRHA